MPFAITGGDGQVTVQGGGTVETLKVHLTDGGGSPIAGQTVIWSLVSGVGMPFPVSSITNPSGVAETRFMGGAIGSVPSEDYKTSIVRASTAGEGDLDFHATTINCKLGGSVDLMPGALVIFPLGWAVRVTGQAGQTLSGYIQVRIGFMSGYTYVLPIPYIGVQLVQTDEVPYQNPAFASATSPLVLTDASGIAILDVSMGASVAGGLAKLMIGIPSYDRSYLCYWPVYLTARASALPQLQPWNWGDYTAIGTLVAAGADSTKPPNQVRVLDSAGAVAAGQAVTWTSVTAGAVSFLNTDLVTDANGMAHSDILAGVTPGTFDVQVTSMGETIAVTIHVVNPGSVTSVTPPSLFPVGAPAGGPAAMFAALSSSRGTAEASGGGAGSRKSATIGLRKQRWYPTLTPGIPHQLVDTQRRILDMVYETQDQLGPVSVSGHGSNRMTIGTTEAPIPGCTFTAPRQGVWSITGRFAVEIIGAGDVGQKVNGSLAVSGQKQLGLAVMKSPAEGLALMGSQSWRVQLAKGQMVALRIGKEIGATGTSTVDGSNSTISAVWQGTS